MLRALVFSVRTLILSLRTLVCLALACGLRTRIAFRLRLGLVQAAGDLLAQPVGVALGNDWLAGNAGFDASCRPPAIAKPADGVMECGA